MVFFLYVLVFGMGVCGSMGGLCGWNLYFGL